MGWKENYVRDADERVAGYIEELRELLCGVIDGTVDTKEISDSLVVLSEIHEDYKVMSGTVKSYDEKFDEIEQTIKA